MIGGSTVAGLEGISSEDCWNICWGEKVSGPAGSGAKSWTDTVDSLPSGYLTHANDWLLSIRLTRSTKGSFLVVRMNHRNNTGPGFINQDGREFPWVVRLWNLKKRSCGVQFVVVHNRDRIEWRTCGRTCSQCLSDSLSDLSANWIVFQTTPTYRSAWPLPCGW